MSTSTQPLTRMKSIRVELTPARLQALLNAALESLTMAELLVADSPSAEAVQLSMNLTATCAAHAQSFGPSVRSQMILALSSPEYADTPQARLLLSLLT